MRLVAVECCLVWIPTSYQGSQGHWRPAEIKVVGPTWMIQEDDQCWGEVTYNFRRKNQSNSSFWVNAWTLAWIFWLRVLSKTKFKDPSTKLIKIQVKILMRIECLLRSRWALGCFWSCWMFLIIKSDLILSSSDRGEICLKSFDGSSRRSMDDFKPLEIGVPIVLVAVTFEVGCAQGVEGEERE